MASPLFSLAVGILLLSKLQEVRPELGVTGAEAVKRPRVRQDVSSSLQQTHAVYIYIYKYIYLTTYLSSANSDNVNSREEQPVCWMEGAEKNNTGERAAVYCVSYCCIAIVMDVGESGHIFDTFLLSSLWRSIFWEERHREGYWRSPPHPQRRGIGVVSHAPAKEKRSPAPSLMSVLLFSCLPFGYFAIPAQTPNVGRRSDCGDTTPNI